jgi:hypothetical protein
MMADETQYGPEPFADPNAPFAGTILNEPVPGSEGGLIEAVKRTVTTALRESITNTGLSIDGGSSRVHIDIEYPMEEESYPGIWVQFSVTSLTRAGLGHEVWVKDAEENWTPIQEWMFNGRVTLTIVALSNKERDRISDALITMFAFSRTTDRVLTNPKKDTKQFRSFLSYLDQSPYVSLTVNTDTLGLGGQGAQMGMLAWQQDMLIYEDTYSFDLVGQFNIQFTNDGWYTLHRIDVKADKIAQDVEYDPTQWRGQPGTEPVGGHYISDNQHMQRPSPATTGYQAVSTRRL